MKQKRQKVICIGNKDISPQGYSYMVLKDSHNLDEVVVKSSKQNLDVAVAVVLLLQLNGWQESEISGYEEKEVKSRCLRCNKVFNGQKNKCPECGNSCNEFSYKNKLYVLEKLGALQSHQAELMADKDWADVFTWVNNKVVGQKLKDRILLTRMD